MAAGVTSMAATSPTPTVCRPTTMVSASRISMANRSVSGRLPSMCASTGSNDASWNSLKKRMSTASTTTARMPVSHRSPALTPSTLPKRMWVRSVA